MDMSLSTLWEVLKDWEAWHAVVHDITETGMTEQLNDNEEKFQQVGMFCESLWAVFSDFHTWNG